jgi:hypothetical protein
VYVVLVSVAVSVVRIVVCAADVVTICVFVTFAKEVLVRVTVLRVVMTDFSVLVKSCVFVAVVVFGTKVVEVTGISVVLVR